MATTSQKYRIAVLISGGGTTLKNLIAKIDDGSLDVEICLVVSSNAKAGGLEFAKNADIPTRVIEQKNFALVQDFSDAIFDSCREAQCDLIVMGGFLKHVLIAPDFENRVINIHPSLIPAFCGKGFFGSRVHKAVIEFGCKVSGCTVHYVDDQYDHGPIIAQQCVNVLETDTPKSLAERIFEAECDIYPRVIADLAKAKKLRE